MGLHRCIQADCIYFAQAATRGCGCHKTDEQVLIDELREARTTLSILRTQVMVELNRGVERWEGVPEALRFRLDAIDAILGEV